MIMRRLDAKDLKKLAPESKPEDMHYRSILPPVSMYHAAG